MNSETGKAYDGPEVDRARARGEKLVEISARAARQIKAARNREAARLKGIRRRRDAVAKASRKRNRR